MIVTALTIVGLLAITYFVFPAQLALREISSSMLALPDATAILNAAPGP